RMTQPSFAGEACRNEFFVFQIGVYAVKRSLDVKVTFSALRAGRASPEASKPVPRFVIPATNFRCLNTGGRDWFGRKLVNTVQVDKGTVQPLWIGVQIPTGAPPGEYHGEVTISSKAVGSLTPVPKAFGKREQVIPIAMKVLPKKL